VTYEDAFLSKFCDSLIETRAYAEVDLYGTFTQAWRDRLVVPQAYVLVCLENQASSEDLFSTKLKTYQKDLERLLVHARNATPDSEGLIAPVFAIPLERA
jgi:hypothetical protein